MAFAMSVTAELDDKLPANQVQATGFLPHLMPEFDDELHANKHLQHLSCCVYDH